MNNDIKFDPMTGQPIQYNNQQIPVPTATNHEQNIVDQNNVNQQVSIQNQLQNIPTVDQNKQDFINNIQTMNQEKKEEKKEGINFTFIIVLFLAVLAIIYFLFPILSDYI